MPSRLFSLPKFSTSRRSRSVDPSVKSTKSTKSGKSGKNGVKSGQDSNVGNAGSTNNVRSGRSGKQSVGHVVNNGGAPPESARPRRGVSMDPSSRAKEALANSSKVSGAGVNSGNNTPNGIHNASNGGMNGHANGNRRHHHQATSTMSITSMGSNSTNGHSKNSRRSNGSHSMTMSITSSRKNRNGKSGHNAQHGNGDLQNGVATTPDRTSRKNGAAGNENSGMNNNATRFSMENDNAANISPHSPLTPNTPPSNGFHTPPNPKHNQPNPTNQLSQGDDSNHSNNPLNNNPARSNHLRQSSHLSHLSEGYESERSERSEFITAFDRSPPSFGEELLDEDGGIFPSLINGDYDTSKSKNGLNGFGLDLYGIGGSFESEVSGHGEQGGSNRHSGSVKELHEENHWHGDPPAILALDDEEDAMDVSPGAVSRGSRASRGSGTVTNRTESHGRGSGSDWFFSFGGGASQGQQMQQAQQHSQKLQHPQHVEPSQSGQPKQNAQGQAQHQKSQFPFGRTKPSRSQESSPTPNAPSSNEEHDGMPARNVKNPRTVSPNRDEAQVHQANNSANNVNHSIDTSNTTNATMTNVSNNDDNNESYASNASYSTSHSTSVTGTTDDLRAWGIDPSTVGAFPTASSGAFPSSKAVPPSPPTAPKAMKEKNGNDDVFGTNFFSNAFDDDGGFGDFDKDGDAFFGSTWTEFQIQDDRDKSGNDASSSKIAKDPLQEPGKHDSTSDRATPVVIPVDPSEEFHSLTPNSPFTPITPTVTTTPSSATTNTTSTTLFTSSSSPSGTFSQPKRSPRDPTPMLKDPIASVTPSPEKKRMDPESSLSEGNQLQHPLRQSQPLQHRHQHPHPLKQHPQQQSQQPTDGKSDVVISFEGLDRLKKPNLEKKVSHGSRQSSRRHRRTPSNGSAGGKSGVSGRLSSHHSHHHRHAGYTGSVGSNSSAVDQILEQYRQKRLAKNKIQQMNGHSSHISSHNSVGAASHTSHNNHRRNPSDQSLSKIIDNLESKASGMSVNSVGNAVTSPSRTSPHSMTSRLQPPLQPQQVQQTHPLNPPQQMEVPQHSQLSQHPHAVPIPSPQSSMTGHSRSTVQYQPHLNAAANEISDRLQYNQQQQKQLQHQQQQQQQQFKRAAAASPTTQITQTTQKTHITETTAGTDEFLLANIEATIGPRGAAPDLESMSGRSHNITQSRRRNRSPVSHREYHNHRNSTDVSVDSRASRASRASRNSFRSYRSNRSALSHMSKESKSVANDLFRLEAQLAMVAKQQQDEQMDQMDPQQQHAHQNHGNPIQSHPSLSMQPSQSQSLSLSTQPTASMTPHIIDNLPSSTSDLSLRSNGAGTIIGAEPMSRLIPVEVVAPPGKLGILLANKSGQKGPTHISAVRSESVLAGKVHVGDRFVSIDGEDVTRMNSKEITTIMARKSDFERVIVLIPMQNVSSRNEWI